MTALHVYETKKGWAVRRPGMRNALGYYPSRGAALERARAYLLRRDGGNIRIHKMGRIERNVKVEV